MDVWLKWIKIDNTPTGAADRIEWFFEEWDSG